MLSVIGLALDIVGASVLARGLFRPSKPSTLGLDVRPPEEAAQDVAYGSIGLCLLVSGFLLQALSNLGVTPDVRGRVSVAAGLAALVVGGVAARVGYRAVYASWLRREGRRREQAAEAQSAE